MELRSCQICIIHCYDAESGKITKESKLGYCEEHKKNAFKFLQNYAKTKNI